MTADVCRLHPCFAGSCRLAPTCHHQELSIKSTSQLLFCAAALIVAACSEPRITNPPSQLARNEVLAANSIVFEEIFIKIPEEDFKEADLNVNGLVCAKDTPSSAIVLHDDNPQTPSQPCPPGFATYGRGASIPIKGAPEGDDNQNGLVCLKETPNGKIVRDDNPASPSQPCPPAFAVIGTVKDPTPKVSEKDLIASDLNQNRMVCLKQAASGHFTISDDNSATPSQPCPPAFLWIATSGVREPLEPPR